MNVIQELAYKQMIDNQKFYIKELTKQRDFYRASVYILAGTIIVAVVSYLNFNIGY